MTKDSISPQLYPMVVAFIDGSCLNELFHRELQNDDFLMLSFLLLLLSGILW